VRPNKGEYEAAIGTVVLQDAWGQRRAIVGAAPNHAVQARCADDERVAGVHPSNMRAERGLEAARVVTYSDTEYNSQNSKTASYTYGQQQHHPSQDYISMLIEESEKLYTSLIKEWEDKIITDYTFSTTSSSLPLLSPSDEKEQQGHPRQTTAANNQRYMYPEEHRFVQSEIDNEEDQDS